MQNYVSAAAIAIAGVKYFFQNNGKGDHPLIQRSPFFIAILLFVR